jgi:hypothetical protein
VTRTIRERPRLAAITALGLGCLLALGLAFGLLLGNGDDADSDRATAAERAALRRPQEQRAAAERQRLRAVAWRGRALRAEQRGRALQRALTPAQAEPD